MNILGFYITITDWQHLWQFERKQVEKLFPYANDLKQKNETLLNELRDAVELLKTLREASYYRDKRGYYRDAVTGRFASKEQTKQINLHEQMRSEIIARQTAYDWEKIRKAK